MLLMKTLSFYCFFITITFIIIRGIFIGDLVFFSYFYDILM